MAHAHRPERTAGYPEIVALDRPSVVLRITLGLQARDGGRRWTVRGGPKGRDYGRLVIGSPPDRREADGRMTDEDRRALTDLLGLSERVGPDGAVVADGYDHYRAYVDRAEGRAPLLTPEEYDWL